MLDSARALFSKRPRIIAASFAILILVAYSTPTKLHHANSNLGNINALNAAENSNDPQKLLSAAVSRLGLSARAYDRVRKVARTIADLAGDEATAADHVAEALQFRMP